jgi:hypothetical protein
MHCKDQKSQNISILLYRDRTTLSAETDLKCTRTSDINQVPLPGPSSNEEFLHELLKSARVVTRIHGRYCSSIMYDGLVTMLQPLAHIVLLHMGILLNDADN